MRELFTQIEHQLMDAVYRRFGVGPPNEEEALLVKEADRRMLITEQHQLMIQVPEIWEVYEKGYPPYEDVKLECWDPETAESRFMDRAYELGIVE
jgi:hypothetical protein